LVAKNSTAERILAESQPKHMPTRSEALQERLAEFAVAVDALIDRIPRDIGGQHAGRQLTRCSTAPLANYCEACEAESTADYLHKMKIALKELRETRGWITYVGKRSRGKLDVSSADKECNELIAIFVTCVKRASGTPERIPRSRVAGK
jgi:four helix bundle protein